MGMLKDSLTFPQPLTPSQIADLRLAASTLTGWKRRAFEAEMALKYCAGTPLQAETTFGWSRRTVALGLAERRTGIRCLGAQATCSGRKRWEDTQPEAADALRRLADAPAQPDPTCRTTLTSTRLTAKAALDALCTQGYSEAQLPAPSTMAEVLNRLGFRLRKVVKAKPQKKIAETDAMFANSEKKTTKRCQRTTSNACASIVKPRSPAATCHGAAGPEAITKLVIPTWACMRSTFRVALWMQQVGSSTSPLAGLIRPVISSWMRVKPGGPPWMRVNRWPWRGCRLKWTTAQKAAGGERHFSSAW